MCKTQKGGVPLSIHITRLYTAPALKTESEPENKNPVLRLCQRTRCISRVTTSIYQFFTKLTSAGIGCDAQINTLCCNGQDRSRLRITQSSPVSWIRNSKAVVHIPFSPPGDSLKDNPAFYWFIVIAVIFIIIHTNILSIKGRSFCKCTQKDVFC